MPKFIDVGVLHKARKCLYEPYRALQHYMIGTGYMKIYEKDFRSKGG